MSRLDDLTEEQKKKYGVLADNDVKVLNKVYGTSAQTVRDDYGALMTETEQSYNEAFDKNNVQRIINERQIAESMANMGLTDSGLNRTQLTANQLSYANNQNKLTVAQQKAVEDLARVMNSKLASLESERASEEQSIRSGYNQQAISDANSIYAAEQEAATEEAKAALEAITATQKQQDSDFKSVMSVMGNANATPALKEQWQRWYGTRYGLDGDALTELFGSTSAKTAYTTDELSSGVTSSGTAIYDDDMIFNALNVYHKSGENSQTLLDTVDELAQQYGWDPSTEEAFYELLLKRTEGTRQFWLNPHLDHTDYTLISKSGKADDNGLFLDTTVKDGYGNTWTLKDVYYASCRALAKNKYKDDWENRIDDSNITKMARDQVKRIQRELKIS